MSVKPTKLEKHLLSQFIRILFKWCFAIGFILYSAYRLFFGAALIGLIWLLFTSFACCENGYIPRYHYFIRYRFSHSYKERLALSDQYESCQYVKIGEGIFLEDYLLWADFGAIVPYSEIKNIHYSKVRNLNVVFVYLKTGKKYSFNISETEYKTSPSLYSKAISYFQKKIQEDNSAL